MHPTCPDCGNTQVKVTSSRERVAANGGPDGLVGTEEITIRCDQCGYTGPAPEQPEKTIESPDSN